MNMDVLVNDESILLRMHVHIEPTEMTLIYDEIPYSLKPAFKVDSVITYSL